MKTVICRSCSMMTTDILEIQEMELNKASRIPAILAIFKSVLCYLHKKRKCRQNKQKTTLLKYFDYSTMELLEALTKKKKTKTKVMVQTIAKFHSES